MTHTPPKRQIFIHDQQLWQLRLTGEKSLEWLTPERFRLAGLPDEELRLVDVDRNPWEAVTHTQILDNLKSGQLQRLCVTTNAGIGKSTFLKWLQWQLSLSDSRLVPVRLELRDLPDNSDDVRALFKKFRSPSVGISGPQGRSQANKSLTLLLQRKRVCLLVDSLDQTSRNLDQRILALHEFLAEELAECPVVVAGRPHAITHFWSDLFHDSPWHMLQPGLFSDDQVRRYLGPKRFNRLQGLGVNVRQNPRAISVIARMDDSRLQELRTEADVYHEMLNEQLQLALRVDALKTLERPHVEFLYCLVAFSLLRDGNRAEVSSTDYSNFVQQLFVERQDEIRKALGRRSLDDNGFSDVMLELLCINDILEHGGFERYGRPQKTEARLAFQNPSQFEFLAAMWLTKWASHADRQWLREHLPGDYEGHVEAINNVWRHLTEMPEAVRTGSECCWLQSIEPLFLPVPEARHARPTEWMYRCWRLLLAYADPDWVEVSVRIPPLKTVKNTDKRFAPIRELAQRILFDFRRKSAQTQNVLEGTPYVWCPPQAAQKPATVAQRTFWMGTPEEKRGRKDFRELLPEPFHKVTIPVEFELQVSPVTNLEYEQFDAWHSSKRNKYRSEDGLAVIYVSLFQSFMYACWMGPDYRLPTEKEWEFACRADSPPGQLRWWNDDDDLAKRWGSDNSGGKVPLSTQQHANAWRVQDQIGLVWEWTSTRSNRGWRELFFDDKVRARAVPARCTDESEAPFADTQTAFVLRGGSWGNFDASNLRCARRLNVQPTLTDGLTGCRLSRVARARKP
jgi:formylglycine-generating enzyme required for sulfatase activity